MPRIPEFLLLRRSSPSKAPPPPSSHQGLLGPSSSSSSSSLPSGFQPRRRRRGVPLAVGAAALVMLSTVLLGPPPWRGPAILGRRDSSSSSSSSEPHQAPPTKKSSEWVDHFVAVFPGSAHWSSNSNNSNNSTNPEMQQQQRRLPNTKIFLTGPWVPQHFLSNRRFRPTATTVVPPENNHNHHHPVADEDGSSSSSHQSSDAPPPPPLLELHHFNNTSVVESVRLIDQELREVAGVHGALEAWITLRPWAFRADLWRYMILWSEGGVYVDAKLRLRAPLDSWAALSPREGLAVCHDHDRTHQSSLHPNDPPLPVLWNGAMSAPPKSPILLEAIQLCISNVQNRVYVLPYFAPNDVGIHGDLAVTGPIVLSFAARRIAGYNGASTTTSNPVPSSHDVSHDDSSRNVSSAVRVSCAYRDAGNGFLEEAPDEHNNAAGARGPPPHQQGPIIFERDTTEHERVRSTNLNYGQLYMIHNVYCDEPLPDNHPDPACVDFAAAQAAAKRAAGAAASELALPTGTA